MPPEMVRSEGSEPIPARAAETRIRADDGNPAADAGRIPKMHRRRPRRNSRPSSRSADLHPFGFDIAFARRETRDGRMSVVRHAGSGVQIHALSHSRTLALSHSRTFALRFDGKRLARALLRSAARAHGDGGAAGAAADLRGRDPAAL